MLIKRVSEKEKAKYNQVVNHPLQSWEWGEFRKKTGVKVVRLGVYKKNTLIKGFQLTVHPLPFPKYTIGYLPKGPEINQLMIETLLNIGQENNCIFIKIEPNIGKIKDENKTHRECANALSRCEWISKIRNLDKKTTLVKSPHPLFPKYTFQLDLKKTEEELLKQMKPKTRYNIKLAQKHEVKVTADASGKAFETFVNLSKETWKRQKFYAHDEKYYRLLWQVLKPAGIAHLLIANYQPPNSKYQLPLVAWVLFLFDDVVYYPYGASSSKYRNVMASNIMMWEAIRWAKKNGAKIFDMWGALGPNPKKDDPWYGFHKFKQGYGGQLIEFAGSYDLVLKPFFYKLYNLLDNFRWLILKFKSRH